MRWRTAFALLACGVSILACGPSTPSPTPAPPTPNPSPPSGPERITGNERLGWNQPAGDAAELTSFSYAIYVDGVRSVLADVSCETTAAANGFACSARLPPMSAGPHALELAAFVVDAGAVVEGSRSASLDVIVVLSSLESGRPSPDGEIVTTSDGVRLRLELVAGGLTRPSDLAFAGDGRIFVAERAGRVRVVRDGRLLADPALDLSEGTAASQTELLALAVGPDFQRTGLVYALFTGSEPSGALVFRLARFRAAGDRLVERAVLLDGIPAASERASAALRVGADGMLYVALDDGGDQRRADDLGSFSGKVLRLTPDGATPRNQPAATPVIASGLRSPLGIDWQPGTGALWVMDEDVPGRTSLRTTAARRAGSRLQRIETPQVLASGGQALAFYRSDRTAAFRDDLFVAAGGGHALLRARLAAEGPMRIESAERLLDDRVGRVRVVAAGRDGAIYFCTDGALARLVPP